MSARSSIRSQSTSPKGPGADWCRRRYRCYLQNRPQTTGRRPQRRCPLHTWPQPEPRQARTDERLPAQPEHRPHGSGEVQRQEERTAFTVAGPWHIEIDGRTPQQRRSRSETLAMCSSTVREAGRYCNHMERRVSRLRHDLRPRVVSSVSRAANSPSLPFSIGTYAGVAICFLSLTFQIAPHD